MEKKAPDSRPSEASGRPSMPITEGRPSIQQSDASRPSMPAGSTARFGTERSGATASARDSQRTSGTARDSARSTKKPPSVVICESAEL